MPLGWIVDRDERPTADPTQLRQGGALLVNTRVNRESGYRPRERLL